MLDTALLLTREPKRALVDIINHHNGTIIEPSRVSISQPQVVSGRKTKVTVTSTNAQGAIYTGQVDFTFNRLDLAEFFAPVTMDISVPYPATTLNVLSALGERFGMVMGEEDFIIEEFNTPGVTAYTLSATPNSLRWYGSVSINLEVTVDLSTHFNATTLDGLTAFPAETPLQNLYQIVVLNGLTYGDLEVNMAGLFLKNSMDVHWKYDELFYKVLQGDYTQPGRDVVDGEIQSLTRGVIPNTAYDIGVPQPTGDDDQNTSLVVTGNGQDGIVGEKTLTYNRMDIAEYFDGIELNYDGTPPITDLALMQLVAADHNLSFNSDDFEEIVIEPETIGEDFTISVKDGSYRWIGTLAMTVNVWDFTPLISGFREIGSTGTYNFSRTNTVYGLGPATPGTPPQPDTLEVCVADVTGRDVTITGTDSGGTHATFTALKDIEHLDYTFDQNGKTLVVYESAGTVNLYWYDPQAADTVEVELSNGTTPYITPDTWNNIVNDSELFLVYVNAGNLCYRRQNERYNTEHLTGIDDAVQILNVEHSDLGRMVVNYYTSAGAVKNIATETFGRWLKDSSSAAFSSEITSIDVSPATTTVAYDEAVNVGAYGTQLTAMDVSLAAYTIDAPYEPVTPMLVGSTTTMDVVSALITTENYDPMSNDVVVQPSTTLNSISGTITVAGIRHTTYDDALADPNVSVAVIPAVAINTLTITVT